MRMSVVAATFGWALACADATGSDTPAPQPPQTAPAEAPSVTGTWVYEEPRSRMREVLVVDGNRGIYAGQERAEGAVMYYQVPVDLTVTGTGVSFVVDARVTLYDAPQTPNAAPVGQEVGIRVLARTYTGTLHGSALTLSCAGDCPSDQPLVFHRR